MSRRRRRGIQTEIIPVEIKKKNPRFRKVLWSIVGLLIFIAVTSFTGFFAPDIYMLMIYGVVLVFLNVYLVYLAGKDT